MRNRISAIQQLSARHPRRDHGSRAGAGHTPIIYIALVLGVLAAPVVEASESISVAVSATVVSVCRFFTSSSSVGAMDVARAGAASATLTYACSNGTAAAFSFAVPAATHLACATCSGTPVAVGDVLATSVGTGRGLSAGRDQTLSITAPLQRAGNDDSSPGAYPRTIVVTVSP